jgi:hypothetical protein
LWLRWDSKERPWKHLLKVTDTTDSQLFFSSTTIQIGNGANTSFWEAIWLQGAAPKDLAPNLYKIVRFKMRTVSTKLHNDKWISNLVGISTVTEMEEFTLLFMALSSVTLTDQPNSISWKWIQDGNYTVASAYECQFHGSFVKFPAMYIWKALAEPKSKFFTWLVLHDRVLTAENMAKKKWPCNPICSLCYCMNETTSHLLTECNYTEAAWNLVASKFALQDYNSLRYAGGPTEWVNQIRRSGSKEEKRKKMGVLSTFWWMIWKERNNRIFQNKEASTQSLALKIQETILFHLVAWCSPAD